MPDIISPGGIIHTMLNSSVQGYLDTLSEEGNSILLKGRSLSRSRNSYFTGKNMSTTELAFNTVSSQFVPQDDYYGTSDLFTDYTDMWGWQRIGMEDAWDITKGNGVIVAVLDTGIDFTHSELENNIWRNDLEYYGLPGVDDDGNGFIDDIKGWDFVGADYNNPVESNNPIDNYGHGTHVAGIIAADENDEGIIGVAPEAKIMSLKVLDDMGSGSLEIVAQAI
ncbi:MAG: S8 family serine peptidase, partial [Candidatus Omnitrophica bacterium]|nr:S8 family serine peptidase [Candidatus Omnitrophota bacterium]